MVRRLLGIFWIGVLAVILCPLIVLQIFFIIFLSQNSVEKYVIPKSYTSVTGLFAQQFAHTPEESELFAQRLRSTLSPDIYSKLAQTLSQQFFGLSNQQASNKELVLELTSFKTALMQELPALVDLLPPCAAADSNSMEFRFCKPTALTTNQPNEKVKKQMVDMIQKEIPPRIVLDEKVHGVIDSALLLRHYMPFLVAGILILGIGILTLIIGISAGRLVYFLGVFVMIIGAFMGVIVFSFVRLPSIAPVFQGMTQSQIDFATFLATEVLRPIAITAAIFFVVGVATLIGNRFLPQAKPR